MNKLFALIAVMISMNATSQTLFTLEDLNFGGQNYRSFIPKNRYLTWWGETLIEQDAEECREALTGKTLFTLDEVNAAADTPKIVSAMDATFPYADQSLVLLKNSKVRLLYDFKAKEVVWRQECAGESHADWNAASRAVAYVKDYQLHVRTTTGDKQLTTDGSREIVYGQSVHRDEFGIRKGTFWNADGTRLAFYRMDQSMVTDYPQVSIYSRIAEVEPDKYPMAGMASHVVTIGIYDIATDRVKYLNTGDPTNRYFTNIAWSPGGEKIYVQELNREQDDMQLVEYDAVTGSRLRVLYTEQDSAYVEPLHPITFLPWDSERYIMQSQRDGYNHIYLRDLEGHERQLTAGAFVVKELVGFDEGTKSVIIITNEASPIQSNIYKVNIKSGKRTAIDNGEGVHTALLSKGGQLVDRYSTPTTPRAITLTSTRKGGSTPLLEAPNPWEGYYTPIFRCGTIKAADDTTDLYYRMVLPADFDETKSYPTVVYVYGGPHAHMVEASWHYGSRSWETYMAQKGYIIFTLDNRGSENRGKAFEQATYRQLGQVEMTDQLRGVEYLRTLPYVDMERLGVHGWSYGGFMTISLMTSAPDVFKVGVAGGPVIDWRWYEVMYGERYMDTPETNAAGYERTSLLNKAGALKGKLQIIIGANDPTVVPQHALSFIDACTEAGTQPDFFIYPGEGHNMMGHKSVHLHERITQYFEDYLK